MITNTLIYLLARGVPGLVNLLAIVVYTRLLTPDDFGKYALIIALSGFLCSVLFYWLNMGIMRFLPGNEGERETILSTVIVSYLVIVLLSAVLGAGIYLMMPPSFYRDAVPLSLALFWLFGLFEITVQVVAASFSPVKYGVLSLIRSASGLLLGVLLIRNGFGAKGPVLGILIGAVLATAFAFREWRGVSIGKADRTRLKQFMTYGFPLTASFALSFIVSASDRFLLTWFLGASAAGLYSAGYDLAFQTVVILMVIVNLAAYPHVVHALEAQGSEAARTQLRKQLTLLLLIAVPAATGMAVCSRNIGAIFLGEAFRESAALVIPWIAFTTVIFGIRSYYADLSFQLGHRTMGQVYVMLASAISNLVLNIMLIPALGLKGALIGSAAAYAIGLLVSLLYGRRAFPLPAPMIDPVKVVLSAAIMAAGLFFLVHLRGTAALAVQIMAGSAIYAVCCILFNVMDVRTRTMNYFRSA